MRTINETRNDLKQGLETTPKHRPPYVIAYEIRDDWKKVYFGAVPYLNVLIQLNSIDDSYGMDSARSIVRYFLGNATTWRGETARRIKSELKSML